MGSIVITSNQLGFIFLKSNILANSLCTPFFPSSLCVKMQAAIKGVNAATISVMGMFKGRLLLSINNSSSHNGAESP